MHNIAILGGAFNPIHIAHIRMAIVAYETFGFDAVVFIPTANAPHKNIDVPASIRFDMVKSAIKNFHYMKINDIELKRDGKSYTFETLKELNQQFSKITWLIGDDAFAEIHTWYKWQSLLDYTDFAVFNRTKTIFNETMQKFIQENKQQIHFVKQNIVDISSTEIRTLIKKDLSIEYLVDKSTEEYIKKFNLYR